MGHGRGRDGSPHTLSLWTPGVPGRGSAFTEPTCPFLWRPPRLTGLLWPLPGASHVPGPAGPCVTGTVTDDGGSCRPRLCPPARPGTPQWGPARAALKGHWVAAQLAALWSGELSEGPPALRPRAHRHCARWGSVARAAAQRPLPWAASEEQARRQGGGEAKATSGRLSVIPGCDSQTAMAPPDQ